MRRGAQHHCGNRPLCERQRLGAITDRHVSAGNAATCSVAGRLIWRYCGVGRTSCLCPRQTEASRKDRRGCGGHGISCCGANRGRASGSVRGVPGYHRSIPSGATAGGVSRNECRWRRQLSSHYAIADSAPQAGADVILPRPRQLGGATIASSESPFPWREPWAPRYAPASSGRGVKTRTARGVAERAIFPVPSHLRFALQAVQPVALRSGVPR